MKVLHLCPLWIPSSQDSSGGVETFITSLASALQKLGIQATLLASGDSISSVEVIPAIPKHLIAMIDEGHAYEYAFYEQHQLQLALQKAKEFDILHSHIGVAGYALSGFPGMQNRVLHTHHTPIYQDLEWFISHHPDIWFAAVSNFLGKKMCAAGSRNCSTVYNGIKVDTFKFQPAPPKSLLFIGRIEHGKGPDLAVKAALQLKLPLTLAGRIIDKSYFDREVQPYLGDQIQYMGVVDHHQKNELYGQSGCLIFPIRHPEAFGLVSVEAMACGTPVVSLANGALPEIIDPGITGYHTTDESQLPNLIQKAFQLDRRKIRDQVTAKFDISTTASNYQNVYQQMLKA